MPTTIPLTALIPDPTQPRKSIPTDDLDRLAGSIRAHGLLMPLRVKPADAAGRHVIVSGHRRHAALSLLGAITADCILADGTNDAVATLAEQLAENIHREDLSPIEEAEGYRRYMDLRGVSAARAAEELQISPTRISRALPLMDLPDAVRAAVHDGRIAKDTGYSLARLSPGEDRDRLIAKALTGSLRRDDAARAAKATRTPVTETTVRRVTCRLSGGRSLTVAGPAIRLDTVIEALEDALKGARRARVQGWDIATLAKVFKDRAAHETPPDTSVTPSE